MLNEAFQNKYQSEIQQFNANRNTFLSQRNVNIPQQYMKSSNTAIQYLMNNGIMTQEQYNQIMQYGAMLGLK